MPENPRVFISYSHQDADYETRVLSFANRLRSEGIDANVDLYEESPKEGWPRWMEKQILEADYVLILCSKSYYDKFYSEEKGKGVVWEVSIVYQILYGEKCETSKFIPIFLENNEKDYIPTPLKPFTYYNVSQEAEYTKLYWRLRGVVKNQKPPLGKLKPMPEKTQKTMFFSSPIDLDKWNAAHWKGILYLFSPGYAPVLGFIFENYKAGQSIFHEWSEMAKRDTADDFLRIDFIIPPFPPDCWIYKDSERNYGKGYFVHVGPNIDQSIKRAEKAGIIRNEMFLASVSRYQWMDEMNGTKNRDCFRMLADENKSGFSVIPIGIRDLKKPYTEDNFIIDFENAINMKAVHFCKGTELNEDNICKVVIRKPSEG